MGYQNLSKDAQLVQFLAANTTGASNGNVVTVGAAESVFCMTSVADNTGSGVTITLQGSTTSAFSASVNLATAATTVKNVGLYIDGIRITYPYIRCTLNTTGSAIPGAVQGLLYGLHKRPSTIASTDATGTVYVCT